MRTAAVDTRSHQQIQRERIQDLTLTLEGLQHGGVRGPQPGGVATQNPLQVVGGIAEEQVRCTVAC